MRTCAFFSVATISCAAIGLVACGGDDASVTSPQDAPLPVDASEAAVDGTVQGDATLDARADAGTDATLDATSDVLADSAGDVALDAPSDVTPDSTPSDAALDAPTDSAVDSGNDAGVAPVAILLAYGAGGAYGTVYQSGAWDSPTRVGTDAYQQGGGGVTASPAGLGYGAFRPGAANTLLSTIWSGSWPTATTLGSKTINFVGVPSSTSQNVYVAVTAAVGSSSLFLETYDYATSTWKTDEAVGPGDGNSKPAVAATASGDPVVAFSPPSGASGAYQWTRRTGATWSAAASVPGITFTGFLPGPPAPLLVKRVGADQIVGIFLASNGSATSISAATFSAGAWSSATTVATDTAWLGYPEQDVAMAALPDGRVALAYVTSSSRNVKVGFFDGATWGTFSTVPSVTVANGTPVSLAHGVSGAVLELVYIDGSSHLQHTRMNTTNTWNAPAVVDASRTYSAVSLAAP